MIEQLVWGLAHLNDQVLEDLTLTVGKLSPAGALGLVSLSRDEFWDEFSTKFSSVSY